MAIKEVIIPIKDLSQVLYSTREAKVVADPIKVIRGALNLAKAVKIAIRTIRSTQMAQVKIKAIRVKQHRIKVARRKMRLPRMSRILNRIMV